ncbi:MAG: methionyl-tRNA formyltransferase [Patescibacteria group bacterium]
MYKFDYVFFGTSNFAGIILDQLLRTGLKPKLTITVQGKPAGRRQEIKKSPVFQLTDKLQLPTIEAASLKTPELVEKINELNCPVGILAAMGKIVPITLINGFARGIVNIHPSLLPKFRGPSPIQYALLNNEQTTGVTLIKLDQELDHGQIIFQQAVTIHPNETLVDLESRLAQISADLLIKTMPDYLVGKTQLVEQNHQQATYSKMIIRDDGKIDWNISAQEIYNQWRAFTPWPGLWTLWQGQRLKLIDLRISDIKVKPSFIELSNNRVLVGTGTNSLELIKLQLAGRQEILATEFIKGRKNFINTKLNT